MKKRWCEKIQIEKILTILNILLPVAVIALLLLQFLGVINYTYGYILPLVGAHRCILAFQEWNEDRDAASLNILLSILIFAVTFVIWFEK